ncbi:hypothetical protein RhiirC2_793104, partial [Rhizophagus irregularis]
TNQYEKSAAKNKISDEEIIEVDRRQASTTPNTGQTSTPKKVDILIVLRYSIPLFKVDRGQTSTTPNIGQTSTPKKSRYIDCFALFHSVIQRCTYYHTSNDQKQAKKMARIA